MKRTEQLIEEAYEIMNPARMNLEEFKSLMLDEDLISDSVIKEIRRRLLKRKIKTILKKDG